MTVSSKTAKKLLYDFMFESESAQEWVEDVWGLSPFLGQGAANASEVLGALISTCSEEQLNDILTSLYSAHKDMIDELASASEWRVPIEPRTSLDDAAGSPST